MSIQIPGMNSTVYWDSQKRDSERSSSTSKMDRLDGIDKELSADRACKKASPAACWSLNSIGPRSRYMFATGDRRLSVFRPSDGAPGDNGIVKEFATMHPEGSELVMVRGQMRYRLASATFDFFIVEIQMR